MLQKIRRSVDAMLGLIAGLALLAMMLLTLVDVIGRYGFKRSVFGASEMIEYLMVLSVFAGIALITHRGDHIAVSLFEGPIQRFAPRLQIHAIRLFSLGCYGVLTWQLWRMGLGAAEEGRLTVVLNLPQWLFAGSAALLSVIGLLLCLERAFSLSEPPVKPQ